MIKLKEKIAYGFGDMASSMFWKIFGMYLLFFYTNVFGISPAAAGTMFLVTRIWDTFFDPVVGIISDRTETKWGKYRPYLLWFAIPFAAIGVLTFYTPDLSATGKLVYAYITYGLMMMVYSLVNVPYASLLGVMSPDPKERNKLSSYRMFFAYAGSFLTFLLLQPLVDFFAKNVSGVTQISGEISHDPTAWTLAVAVIGVICATLFFLCFKWTKERVEPIDEVANKSSVKEDVMALLKSSPWWILLGAGIASLLFNSIRDGVTLFYFADFIKGDTRLLGLGLGALYLVVGQASNMIGVVLAAPVSNRIGKKNTFIGAMVIASILSAIFFYFTADQLALIFIFQVLISICAGSIFPMLWSMYADIADYQELTTGRRMTGLIFSSSSMSQKFGWAIGGALTGWLLAVFGYEPNLAVQSGSAIMGIKMMMSWLPAISCILAVIAISFYPLSEQRVGKIVSQLEEKRHSSK